MVILSNRLSGFVVWNIPRWFFSMFHYIWIHTFHHSGVMPCWPWKSDSTWNARGCFLLKLFSDGKEGPCVVPAFSPNGNVHAIFPFPSHPLLHQQLLLASFYFHCFLFRSLLCLFYLQSACLDRVRWSEELNNIFRFNEFS